MQRADQLRPIWLLLLLLLLQVGHQCQATADCMKNPFASVCRGISAKRSGVLAGAGNEQRQQRRLLAGQPQRANELADLLNKLDSLSQQQQGPPPRPLADLLVRHWAAAASASASQNSPAKTVWPLALGDLLYYERQPPDSMAPVSSPPLVSFGIGATGNE